MATLAEALAKRAGGCDPACAWAAGLLAPLGWLAVAAVDPAAVGEVLREPVYADQFPAIQRDRWRLDAPAIARRLARRWNLPDWLRVIVGHLDLPWELAAPLGADERLFLIAQLAVSLARGLGHDLGLAVGSNDADLMEGLGLNESDIARVMADHPASVTTPSATAASADLLPDLLAIAIEKRRLQQGPTGERLETEVDSLHEALAQQHGNEARRLHRSKLRSLAEFAAGAGHEINNPLAVISGQAQSLLRREEDADQQGALRGIIRQTERIHHILTDLMQFARPPQARRLSIDLRSVVANVVAKYTAQADESDIQLDWREPPEPMTAEADGAMISTALACLLRNSLDAAGQGGSVRLTASRIDEEWRIVIEDSGPRIAERRREHLFDPFFSGRQAGRGRGLGLPTAWRLATENGGDVRLDAAADGPTRFILALPICPRGTATLEPAREALRLTA